MQRKSTVLLTMSYPPWCLTLAWYFPKFEIVTRRLPLASLVATPEHVDAFKALANPGRLEVFFTLVKARGELAAGEVQEALGIPGPTLSHHLEQLRRAGLIQSRRQERFIYYSVRSPMVSDLVRILTACC
jgi:ArsR family transcriptional regulator, arsenate/arsenite/antimonite-responsive transcriptional repressor